MKKILMIATCNFITNHNDGGRQCSYRNYDFLCQTFGKDNVMLYMITNDLIENNQNITCYPTYRNKIQQIVWALKCRNGYSRKTEEKIISDVEATNWDYIWFDRSTLGSLCKKIRINAKKIVFFHNIEKEYIKNKIQHENIGYILSYHAFVKNEEIAINEATRVLCLNQRDSEKLYKNYGRKADFLLPISFQDTYRGNEWHQVDKIGKKLLFVGSYFQPNIEGIEWFIQNVMPKLCDVQLIIVGKDMEKKANEWNSERVKVIGTVSNLSEYYMKADAVVLPIFYGDGMKVKTAEALMYGKIIFGSREAFEGYEVDGNRDVVRCDTAEEYIYNIIQFYQEKPKDYFSMENRQLFLDRYENKTLSKKFKEFIYK